MPEPTSAQRDDSLLPRVACQLESRRPELVAAQIHSLRGFAPYDHVPEGDLTLSCDRNVTRVLSALTGHEEQADACAEDERASGRRRAAQAISTEDLVKAYRLVLGVLRDAFIDEATHLAADPWQVLEGTRTLWELTDRYCDVLVASRQQAEVDMVRRDEQLRVELVHTLVSGRYAPSDLLVGGAIQTLLPDTAYWVARARQISGTSWALRARIEAKSQRGHRLIAPMDSDIVIISAACPEPADDAIIAVSRPVPLHGIPRAFAEASRVLQTAVRLGRTGVIDRYTLSVRMAVEEQRDLGEELARKYLIPTDENPANADVLDTVSVYLQLNRSVGHTAEKLSVHPNTVRYRLARFGELTGADLMNTTTLVEVWWAMEYRAQFGRPKS